MPHHLLSSAAQAFFLHDLLSISSSRLNAHLQYSSSPTSFRALLKLPLFFIKLYCHRIRLLSSHDHLLCSTLSYCISSILESFKHSTPLPSRLYASINQSQCLFTAHTFYHEGPSPWWISPISGGIIRVSQLLHSHRILRIPISNGHALPYSSLHFH